MQPEKKYKNITRSGKVWPNSLNLDVFFFQIETTFSMKPNRPTDISKWWGPGTNDLQPARGPGGGAENGESALGF